MHLTPIRAWSILRYSCRNYTHSCWIRIKEQIKHELTQKKNQPGTSSVLNYISTVCRLFNVHPQEDSSSWCTSASSFNTYCAFGGNQASSAALVNDIPQLKRLEQLRGERTTAHLQNILNCPTPEEDRHLKLCFIILTQEKKEALPSTLNECPTTALREGTVSTVWSFMTSNARSDLSPDLGHICIIIASVPGEANGRNKFFHLLWSREWCSFSGSNTLTHRWYKCTNKPAQPPQMHMSCVSDVW